MEKIILCGNSNFSILWKESNYGATWMDLLQNLITQKELTRIHSLLHNENKPKVNYVDASAVKTSRAQLVCCAFSIILVRSWYIDN